VSEEPDILARSSQAWGGLAPTYWAAALKLQDGRVAATHQELIDAPRGSDERRSAFQRLHIEAHFLLIAFAHLLRALDTCAEVLKDERISAIRADIRKRAPWLKNFRDAIEHLDEYISGRGRLHQQRKLDERATPYLTFGPGNIPLEVFAQLGSWRLSLRAAAEAGARLGYLLGEAWESEFGPEQPNVGWGRGT